ncbi:MAG: hypothetical protein CMJ47_00825 [Planctomyces sp.]|nr:hypothetical protein [Planctomyces sp.]
MDHRPYGHLWFLWPENHGNQPEHRESVEPGAMLVSRSRTSMLRERLAETSAYRIISAWRQSQEVGLDLTAVPKTPLTQATD